MKFYDSFYEILRNFMTLIVSQKQNTEIKANMTIIQLQNNKSTFIVYYFIDIRLILRL